MRQLLILSLLTMITACSSQFPNQTVVGQPFPEVTGQSLEREDVVIPQAFEGDITLLLLGYKQNSQFDIDRWLIGLDMTQTRVNVYELPTMQGMFPKMFSTMIDNGMRAGIPKPLWKGVITIYQGGESVQKFTGNTNPNNARVALLDSSGSVRYFYDQGFSVDALNEVRKTLNELRKAESKS